MPNLSTFPPFHSSTHIATGKMPVVPVAHRMPIGAPMSGFEKPPKSAPNVEKGAEMNGRNLWGHTLAPLMPEGEANAWDGLVQDMNGEAAR